MSNPVVPIEKVGTCPSGYTTQGNMCVPGSSAKPAIIKVGTCPSGWSTSGGGGYCVANSSNPKHVMPKAGGSCPSGYSTQGSYCVKS